MPCQQQVKIAYLWSRYFALARAFSAVNPEATEICDNEVDDDCDGIVLDCAIEISLSTATLKLVGEDDGDNAGQFLAPAGDFNGDGYDDFLVSAMWDDVTWEETDGRGGGADAGSVYLWLGPVSAGPEQRSLAEAPFKFVGEYAGNLTGYSAGSAGDINGDGIDDLLIGATSEDTGGTNAGAFYLVYGGSFAPEEGVVFLEDADLELYGENAVDGLGSDVARGAFGEGGVAALALGAYDTDTVGAITAYVVESSALAALGPEPVDMVSVGVKIYAENGLDITRRLANAGDLDGDGFDELVIGACKSDLAAADGGAVYVINGPISAALSLADADTILTLAETAAYLFPIRKWLPSPERPIPSPGTSAQPLEIALLFRRVTQDAPGSKATRSGSVHLFRMGTIKGYFRDCLHDSYPLGAGLEEGTSWRDGRACLPWQHTQGSSKRRIAWGLRLMCSAMSEMVSDLRSVPEESQK